jgi:hypothetical protein
MSFYYGTVQGGTSEASRQGTKKTGLVTHTASMEGAVKVVLDYDDKLEKVVATISLTSWPYANAGIDRHLMTIPIDGSEA